MIVTIIIATRNRSAALRDTLRALDQVQPPAGLETEVLVVDNGSTDNTCACVTAATVWAQPVRYLHEPRRGKSTALNAALAAARGDILAFLDDDIRPTAGWLEHITAPLVEQRYDALAGAVRIAPHLLRPWMKPAHLAWLAATDPLDPARPRAAVGANLAIARAVLDRVPGFDSDLGPGRLGLWEDTLFASQLIRAGCRLGFAADAMVEHHFDPARLSRHAFLAHAQKQGRSSAYVAWHWSHDDRPETGRYALNYRLRLWAKRILRGHECDRTDGIASWEMDLTCGIAFADQWRIERRRPRAYPRFGTHKLRWS
jgi:glycosyltransferase involved in cell wall biosynthesis